jgi:probable F420-dependent oxidoreductase
MGKDARSREFRFGVGLRVAKSQTSVQEAARRAEDLGFDVLLVPDHLGAPAPFPTLMSAAQSTTTIHLGTFVLNACFYKPALLARDVAAMNDLSGGRFELGLGAGYVREEFDAAELPFPSAGRRIEYLEHVTAHIKASLPELPILIAGNGDKLLTVAAHHAEIIGLTGGQPITEGHDPLADRIAFVRSAAGDRGEDLEWNLAITAVPSDGSGVPNLAMTRRYSPDLSEEQLLALPSVLSGSPRDIADDLRRHRETYGLTYITVQDGHAEAFAKVIAELR